jgi:hypothetical protein
VATPPVPSAPVSAESATASQVGPVGQKGDTTMHDTWTCRSRELLTAAAPASGRLAVPASRGSPASCRLSGPKRGARDAGELWDLKSAGAARKGQWA